MGYGIIFTLDDRLVRSTPTERRARLLADGLVALLDVGRYPTAGVRPAGAGPWRRLGAHHSNDVAVYTITDDGSVENDTKSSVGGDHVTGDWVAAMTASRHRAALEAAARTMVRRGVPVADALYGPDRVRGAGVRSVWWLYADALGQGPATDLVDAVAETLAAGIEDRFFTGVDLGRHLSAFNRAGVLTGPGPVTVVWSLNRLCALDELDDDERARVDALLTRGSR